MHFFYSYPTSVKEDVDFYCYVYRNSLPLYERERESANQTSLRLGILFTITPTGIIERKKF